MSLGDGSDAPDKWGKAIWASDGIHPNDEGYRIWGEHIGMSIVRQALLGTPPSEAVSNSNSVSGLGRLAAAGGLAAGGLAASASQ